MQNAEFRMQEFFFRQGYYNISASICSICVICVLFAVIFNNEHIEAAPAADIGGFSRILECRKGEYANNESNLTADWELWTEDSYPFLLNSTSSLPDPLTSPTDHFVMTSELMIPLILSRAYRLNNIPAMSARIAITLVRASART